MQAVAVHFSMDRTAHWEQVYRTKSLDAVSWYQPEARLSREYIERLAPDRHARIVDVGAGASVLPDDLMRAGYRHLTVLDISTAALAVTRSRLGEAGEDVTWIAGDVLGVSLPANAYDVWHDRAVFHFLTEADDRARYVAQVGHAVRAGGHVIVATFAEDGPTRCSGLEVCRYSAETLAREFGGGFERVDARRQEHVTPSGTVQAFTWAVLSRRDR